jgi:hypothetical protein
MFVNHGPSFAGVPGDTASNSYADPNLGHPQQYNSGYNDHNNRGGNLNSASNNDYYSNQDINFARKCSVGKRVNNSSQYYSPFYNTHGCNHVNQQNNRDLYAHLNSGSSTNTNHQVTHGENTSLDRVHGLNANNDIELFKQCWKCGYVNHKNSNKCGSKTCPRNNIN